VQIESVRDVPDIVGIRDRDAERRTAEEVA